MTERPAKTAFKEVSPRAAEGIFLQRRCACDNHTHGAQCEDCARNHIQRKPTHQPAGPTIPTIVGHVLGSPHQRHRKCLVEVQSSSGGNTPSRP